MLFNICCDLAQQMEHFANLLSMWERAQTFCLSHSNLLAEVVSNSPSSSWCEERHLTSIAALWGAVMHCSVKLNSGKVFGSVFLFILYCENVFSSATAQDFYDEHNGQTVSHLLAPKASRDPPH